MGVHASLALNRAITHTHCHTIEFNFCSPAEAVVESGTQASLICCGLCHCSNLLISVIIAFQWLMIMMMIMMIMTAI